VDSGGTATRRPYRRLRAGAVPYDARVDDCVFCKIAAKELPATVVEETDTTVAFRDIAPKAPVHVLVIPKAHYRDLADLTAADPGLAGQLFAAAARVAQAEGLSDGYRTIVNTGPHSGQEVFHVHVHVLGGRPLGPMISA
jgi:histidine triad (HIT) family protein